MFLGIDPLYWVLMIPVIIISLIAQLRIKLTYSKYAKIGTHSGLTGAQAARRILDRHGLGGIKVIQTRGFLSDHYDPAKRQVRLSPAVYRSNSLAAVGVAAHEVGHAIQHARSYAPLMLRNVMVPIASIGSNLAWVIIIAGFIFGMLGLVHAGIIIFSLVVVFQILNLPVEFNASRHARVLLVNDGILSRAELTGASRVLSSAALTYVAAALSSIVTLLYFLLRGGILGGRRN